MGLDTTHDCWHGSYSSFSAWRSELAKAAGLPPLNQMQGFTGDSTGIKWDILKPSPLHILLNHSDCDGKIRWQDAASIADELDKLMDELPDSDAPFLNHKQLTQRFAKGLRLAHSKQENVEFY